EGIKHAMSRFNGDITENGTDGKESKPDAKEQLKVAQRAHELNPDDPKPLQEIIRLHKKMRNLDDAVRGHLMLAELYNRQDKPKQMLHEWEVATKIRPALIDVREEIAITYEEQGNTKRAVHTWLKLAQYHNAQGEIDNALAATQEAIRLDPENAKAMSYQVEFTNKLTM
ncbi:MAG: tetratricopeptide repeat protein, partial [Chloroflexota bacterium]